MHLLREGQFSVAATFLSEITDQKSMLEEEIVSRSNLQTSNLFNIDEVPSTEIRKQFASMYYILHELKEKRNLLPAIEWSRENRESLAARGSNLEFELCRLQYVWLYYNKSLEPTDSPGNWQAAVNYARQEFQSFGPRYLPEIQKLLGAMAFIPNIQGSPYAATFNNPTAWEDVSQSFTREFCSLLGLSADSPLYIAATAGAIALPTLLKLQTIMKAKRTEWTTENELPVSVHLPLVKRVAADNALRLKFHFLRLIFSTRFLSVRSLKNRRPMKIPR